MPPDHSTTVDGDIVAAIAWCRIGRHRPKDDGAFHRAKELGLLAQDSTWRATERGEGVLVAAGLLKGKPAPERTCVAMRWAVCERYSRPQLVNAWSEWAYEHITENELDEADQAFRDHGDETDWRFWTTYEHVDSPEPPPPTRDCEHCGAEHSSCDQCGATTAERVCPSCGSLTCEMEAMAVGDAREERDLSRVPEEGYDRA